MLRQELCQWHAAQSWPERAGEAIRALACRPLLLWALLFALNAAARPYVGLMHDARLYSVQVLNHLDEGAFADDLFFRYGSQDRFSLFARLLAPLAGVLGIPGTFFLLYLLGTGLFIFAAQRFVQALIADRVLSTLGLLYIVVTPLPFGGLQIFHVHEPFLTPRLLTNALMLLALEHTSRHRWASAFVLGVLAGLLHPLMAVGGVLVMAGYFCVQTFGGKGTALIVTLVLAVSALGMSALAVSGSQARVGMAVMDAEWRELIRRAAAFTFPSLWTPFDWLNVGVSLLVVLGAAAVMARESMHPARFLIVLGLVGAAGVLATLLATMMPYALLLQAQPYRVLWILKVLQAPLGIWLAWRLWQADALISKGAALTLGMCLGSTTWLPLEALLPLLFLPLFVLRQRGLAKEPRRADWLGRSALGSLCAGAVAWAAYKVSLIVFHRDRLLNHVDTLEYVHTLFANVGPVCWLLGTAILLAVVYRERFSPRFAGVLLSAVLLAAAVAIQRVAFLISAEPHLRARHVQHDRDYRFVHDFLGRPGSRASRVTVYCSLGRVEQLWLQCRMNSYFHQVQVVGVLFSRQTAVEGLRRAELVRAFEMDLERKHEPFLSAARKRWLGDLFQTNFDCPPPSPHDLERLCGDAAVDYVVIPQRFPGLYQATNGTVFIYECRQVRAALAKHSASLAQAADKDSPTAR